MSAWLDTVGGKWENVFFFLEFGWTDPLKQDPKPSVLKGTADDPLFSCGCQK